MSPVGRVMVSAASLYVLMTSLAAGVDVYDDTPPGDLGLMLQEHNYISEGPGSALEVGDDDPLKSLVLFKMLTSMSNKAAPPNLLAGPNWVTSDTDLVPVDPLDLSLLKRNMMKRVSEVGSIVPKPKAGKPPGKKWKSKKGKVGSHMICYFKLCAFRPPNYS